MSRFASWTAQQWDVITFNFGLHDGGVAVADYTANMEAITAKLAATGARLILVTTTMPGGSGGPAAGNAGVVAFNTAAAAVAAKVRHRSFERFHRLSFALSLSCSAAVSDRGTVARSMRAWPCSTSLRRWASVARSAPAASPTATRPATGVSCGTGSRRRSRRRWQARPVRPTAVRPE